MRAGRSTASGGRPARRPRSTSTPTSPRTGVRRLRHVARGRPTTSASSTRGRTGSSTTRTRTACSINYWDTRSSDNNVGDHPGEGLILPVDAHPALEHWSNGHLMRPRHPVVRLDLRARADRRDHAAPEQRRRRRSRRSRRCRSSTTRRPGGADDGPHAASHGRYQPGWYERRTCRRRARRSGSRRQRSGQVHADPGGAGELAEPPPRVRPRGSACGPPLALFSAEKARDAIARAAALVADRHHHGRRAPSIVADMRIANVPRAPAVTCVATRFARPCSTITRTRSEAWKPVPRTIARPRPPAPCRRRPGVPARPPAAGRSAGTASRKTTTTRSADGPSGVKSRTSAVVRCLTMAKLGIDSRRYRERDGDGPLRRDPRRMSEESPYAQEEHPLGRRCVRPAGVRAAAGIAAVLTTDSDGGNAAVAQANVPAAKEALEFVRSGGQDRPHRACRCRSARRQAGRQREIWSGASAEAYADQAYPHEHRLRAGPGVARAGEELRLEGRQPQGRLGRGRSLHAGCRPRGDADERHSRRSGPAGRRRSPSTRTATSTPAASTRALRAAASGGPITRSRGARTGSRSPTASTRRPSATSSIDPHDRSGKTIYLGTGEPSGSGDSEAGLGLYKSTDRGNHWSLVSGSRAVAKDRAIGEVAVDPQPAAHPHRHRGRAALALGRDRRALHASERADVGVYESTDGGASFHLVLNRAGPGQPGQPDRR